MPDGKSRGNETPGPWVKRLSVRNSTEAFKGLSDPAVAVRGPWRGYWPVLAVLFSILIACASNPRRLTK